MKIILICICALIVTGCAGSLALIDKTGASYPGRFDSISKTMEVDVGGKTYKGDYITNAGQTYGSAQIYGTKPTWATTQTTSSGNHGRALLVAFDGSTLACEFDYQGMKAIGTCQDNAGNNYNLTTR